MNRTLLILLLATASHAIEVDYGQGNFAMEGGFLGLSGEINCDINTFSIANRHSRVGDFFYGYNLDWYDSKRMVQAQKSYNEFANTGNSMVNSLPIGDSATIPEMEYRLKGLDANLQFGYDLMDKSDDDYIGVGLLIGISMPWIDATKSGDVTPNLGFMLDNADH
ncbi:MAG TPA: hypothetical protein ENK86_00915, partial [Campylobacterales bacterium]|nr:hypothetical protein [Campylobacterales bacterium]